MKIVSNGKTLEVSGGGCGGGNPIGTVISFLGKTAPEGYLACDGKTYNIADYPSLAEFFSVQFGAAEYFGGNGTSTFAVPDMRNLFLRGYHGEGEEQRSGEIGIMQDGTMIPNIYLGYPPSGISIMLPLKNETEVTNYLEDPDHDERSELDTTYFYYSTVQKGTIQGKRTFKYSARPSNMAVLYCIKATNE